MVQILPNILRPSDVEYDHDEFMQPVFDPKINGDLHFTEQ